VIELSMPSLREMREDIPLLAALLLERQRGEGDEPRLAAGALAALQKYDFPGNVRELENILERALALASGDEIVEADLGLAVADAGGGKATADDAPHSSLSLPEKLESIERQAILDALEKTRYNRTAAAKLLGVSFRALRYRMERLGIKDEIDAKS
jgi:two-component system response regulator PilR (NtrC family)